jgi:EAL and modified HD-GYP domain-containing signal transduction protein
MTTQVLVGRQPIYNQKLDVVAYELLYRDANNEDSAEFHDADQATTEVIINTFLEIGLENITGQLPAYINLTRSYLLGEKTLPIQKDQVVLEVLENVEIDSQLIDRLRELSKQGYTIALDDYLYQEHHDELIKIANIIKIDVLSLSQDDIKQQVDVLKKHDVSLLAEKIETQDIFEFCQSAGFDLYQGFFLSKPKTISGQQISTNRLPILRLMSMLHDVNVEISDLENIINQDVSLSYRLMRYINSSFFGLRIKIESVNHALVLLGITEIRHWISLICMSRIEDKPSYMTTTALVRSRMCELLAKASGDGNSSSYFTVGLFSNLDALLDMTMEEILATMPLSEAIAQALLNGDGIMGAALNCTLQYEKGNWEAVSFCELDISTIKDCYLQSIKWARDVMQELQI